MATKTADAWTPDFGATNAFTPIWPRGEYEVETKDVRGAAWEKTDEKSGTSILVKRIRITAKLNGVYDSEGELQDAGTDGKNVKDEDVTPFDIYLHSEGAMRMGKRIMMAILGYDKDDEEEFNEWAASQDLSFNAEENEDGSYDVTLGDGWDALKGRLFIASLEPQMDDYGGEEREVQNVRSTRPVG